MDLSRFASGPGMGLVTAKDPRSSIIVFYTERRNCMSGMLYLPNEQSNNEVCIRNKIGIASSQRILFSLTVSETNVEL